MLSRSVLALSAAAALLALGPNLPLPKKIVQGEGRGKPDEIREVGYRYEELRRRGHLAKLLGDLETGSQRTAIQFDATTRVLTGGADVRRDRYLLGW